MPTKESPKQDNIEHCKLCRKDKPSDDFAHVKRGKIKEGEALGPLLCEKCYQAHKAKTEPDPYYAQWSLLNEELIRLGSNQNPTSVLLAISNIYKVDKRTL